MTSPRRGQPTPTNVDDAGALGMYKVAYEEGKKLVADQVAELDSMRQRSVQFLALIGSATAFLIGTGLSGSSRDRVFVWLAGGASVLTALAMTMVVFVLLSVTVQDKGEHQRIEAGAQEGVDAVRAMSWWRRLRRLRFVRRHWNFGVDPRRLVEEWIEPDVGRAAESALYRDLAVHYAEKAEENAPALGKIRVWYLTFVVAAMAQLVVWAAVVWRYA